MAHTAKESAHADSAALRAEFSVHTYCAALRAEFYALPHTAMVDRDTVAAVRYLKRQTIEKEAIRGGGIPYRTVGRRALYRKADVLAWMERNSVVENTAQLQGAAA